jgi:hypothetical protein
MTREARSPFSDIFDRAGESFERHVFHVSVEVATDDNESAGVLVEDLVNQHSSLERLRGQER